MRPCPQQILRGELVDEQSPEKTGELESEIHDEEVIIDSLPLLDLDDHEDVDNDRPRRFRKPPSWMKDYERLDKDLQDTLSRSRHSHSTPIPGFASDSGIITTQRDWNDYRSHFEACSSINGWDNLEKGLYLAASLRGQAHGVLGDLSDDKKSYFDQLVRSLEEKFAPPNQSELYRLQLKERKQRASETLPELGQTIRRLVNKAYPTAPGEETLQRTLFGCID
ncbi:unnamed protein product [Mytilus edulis]|uniref:Uncharacterized protein n=1 Tax=Mytilus edulis TaxID=6550 RepID=A0A8S3V9X0_MYTED|nr:unnamed protein product [Mytilus edulis]